MAICKRGNPSPLVTNLPAKSMRPATEIDHGTAREEQPQLTFCGEMRKVHDLCIIPAIGTADSQIHTPKTFSELVEVCNNIPNNSNGSEMTIIDLGGRTITSGADTETDIILGNNVTLRNGRLHLPGGPKLILRGDNPCLEYLAVRGKGRQEYGDVDELEVGLVWVDGARAMLRQCICRDATKGSGLVVDGEGSHVEAVDCAFENNCDGSLRVENAAIADLTRCSLDDHTCNCELPCTCGMATDSPEDHTAQVHDTTGSLDPGQYNPYQLKTLRNGEAVAADKSVAIHDDHCFIDGSNKDRVKLKNCTLRKASPATFRLCQPRSGRGTPEIKQGSGRTPDACCYIEGPIKAMSDPKSCAIMKASPAPSGQCQPRSGRDTPEIKQESDRTPDACC
eukprot:gene23117-30318_t